MYLILRYQIVSSRTLCILTVHFNPTDCGTYKVTKCTYSFILSACVLRPLHRCYVLYIGAFLTVKEKCKRKCGSSNT